MRPTALLAVLACLLPIAACQPRGGADAERIAALEAQVEALRKAAPAASPEGAEEGPELGAQMLELQVRHARLWQAGAARNWMLTQFQLAELRESLQGVVATNGEHAALQPQRLADVLPAMMDPAVDAMQASVDAQDGARFDAAYDGLSKACTDCHAAADHGFLVIQRPATPLLDNLRSEPLPAPAAP